MDNKIFVPKELKQKETIIMHIPVIGRPITSRHLMYAPIGAVLGVIIAFLYSKLFYPGLSLKDMAIDRAAMYVIEILIFFLFPMGIFMVLSGRKQEGLYLEEKFFRKLKHNSSSKVLLNEKASRYIYRKR